MRTYILFNVDNKKYMIMRNTEESRFLLNLFRIANPGRSLVLNIKGNK